MGRTSLRPWFMGNKMQFEAVACRLFLHYSYTLAQKASNYGIFCFQNKNSFVRKDVPVLDLNAFTAGVEPGGLTHGYEIKILVCYLLGQIGTGMTFTQISDALLHRGLVNYFELANALSDLTESGHLTCEDCAGRQEDTSYHLTDLGRQTACTFSGTLPVSVREKAVKSARHQLLRRKIESSNHASIRKAEDGYIVDMTICDIGSDLLSLSLFMPTEQEAEQVRQHFLSDPLLTYKGVLALLTGDLQTVGQLIPTKDEDYQ